MEFMLIKSRDMEFMLIKMVFNCAISFYKWRTPKNHVQLMVSKPFTVESEVFFLWKYFAEKGFIKVFY